jgi:hypothetical protein
MSRRHRHRENKVKKMHTIIGDYSRIFDDIARVPGVTAVNPGPISLNKADQDELTFQYFTESGMKLLAKTTEAVQEVFLVCLHKEDVLAELKRRGFIREREKKMKKKNAMKKQAPLHAKPKRDIRYNPSDMPKEAKPATLKDMLNPDVLAKLQQQSQAMKEQERIAEEKRRKDEIERRAREQKALENNFEYLLNNSRLDWKNFK